MSEFDKLLEDVGREVFSEALNSPELIQKTIPDVLKRRLLGLLEAGQAMRDCNYINSANSMKWDAAKQAAMEGR